MKIADIFSVHHLSHMRTEDNTLAIMRYITRENYLKSYYLQAAAKTNIVSDKTEM